MTPGTRRLIFRCIHLIASIPILGYIYGNPSEVQQYASATRFLFVPAILFSGYWMYAGVAFAVSGVALWLGVYYMFGVGTALIIQIALFVARQIWFLVRARQSKKVEV
jgi:hypothetical protein